MLYWQPSASLAHLRLRAKLLQQIRQFFIARDVLEVETPLLCRCSVPDPEIESIPALLQHPAQLSSIDPYYLQTSPEFAMKRLLAAGSGSIFQITKAFRQAEVGRYHNPEFSIIEWYQVNRDYHALMDEVDALLQYVLHTPVSERYSYKQLFTEFLGINPHTARIATLSACAKQHAIEVGSSTQINKDTWLQLLLSHYIAPRLQRSQPYFIYDFPTSQSALAKVVRCTTQEAVAARFEAYYQGIELANGFEELQDAAEQRKRFEAQCQEREARGLQMMLIDERFLAALTAGLPQCAGVAIGLDRLVMMASQAQRIGEVISFDINRA